MEDVWPALLTSAVTLVGVPLSNQSSKAVMEEKIDELSSKVEKHNCVVERVYHLESRQAANEERFKTLFSDIDDIKKEA